MRALHVLPLLLVACGTGPLDPAPSAPPCAVAAAEPPADAGRDAPRDAGPAADAGFGPCDDGLVLDHGLCVGWRAARPPQRCLRARPALVQTDVVPPWTALPLLAIACDGEPPQVYRPDADRWERVETVRAIPLVPPELPSPPTAAPFLAAATSPDGTRVALAGSLHAHPPFETWIAEPGATAWRRSIDAPWANPVGAGAIADDTLLFSGDDAFVFVARPASAR